MKIVFQNLLKHLLYQLNVDLIQCYANIDSEDRDISMKMLIKLQIIAFSLLFGLSNSLVMAQTPFADLPTPLWGTVTGATGVKYFNSPDEACRAQHAAYNPGAAYLKPAPYRGSWISYQCNWTRNAKSNTLLPTIFSLSYQPNMAFIDLRKPRSK